MKALYINKEGKVQYIADLPEEPKAICDQSKESYQNWYKALQDAKDSAIDCADQEAWKFQLWCISRILLNSTLEEWLSKNLDTIHPFPEGYEVTKEKWGVCCSPMPEYGVVHHGAYCSECAKYSEIEEAVITKKEEPKQEELREKIEFIKGAFQCYVGYENTDGLVTFLQESKFQITRKDNG